MKANSQSVPFAAVLFGFAWGAFGQSTLQYEKWITTFAARTAQILTLDSQGNIYIAGLGFPNQPITANAFAPTAVSALYPQGYVLELDPTGSKVLYGSFLNGLTPIRIAVDPSGFIYILSVHQEPDPAEEVVSFPAAITPNAAQTYSGFESTPVLMKIAPSGELVYGTYLGGLESYASGLAVDASGAATVCGYTVDPGLPVSMNAYQSQLSDLTDLFITRISADGSKFEALTYLGSTGADFCSDVKLDASGNVYVFGDTDSRFFPVTKGSYQTNAKGLENLIVAKMDHSLTSLIWSTYVGSSGIDYAESLVLGPNGGLLLIGTTQSEDFPVTPGTTPPYLQPAPFDSYVHEMVQRPYLAQLDPAGTQLQSAYVMPFEGDWLGSSSQGSIFFGAAWGTVGSITTNATLNAEAPSGLLQSGSIYSYPYLVRFDPATDRPTYLGPVGQIDGLNSLPAVGIATDTAGNPVITSSPALSTYNFPGVPFTQLSQTGQYDQVSVVFNLDFSGEKRPLMTQVINPASLLAAPTAPGQLMQVCGLGFGSLSNTRVMIDGAAVPVISVAPDSIQVVAPASLANEATFSLVVQNAGVSSDARSVPAAAVNPALFTAGNLGSGQALATNADGTANSPQQPAGKGLALRLFATGLGITDTSGHPVAAVTATISGVPAAIQAIAAAAGYPGGYFAIDIVLPQTAPEGDFVPVVITAGGASSPTGVTVALR